MLEVSITSTPVHPATRTIAWKSAAVESKLYEDPATGRRMNARELREYVAAKVRAEKAAKPIQIVTFEIG